jgi:RNA 2',3'-cyclic 3'-phosphodiesterase
LNSPPAHGWDGYVDGRDEPVLPGWDCTWNMSTCRRLFFAFWPDPHQQAALAEAARGVVERSGGQGVPPENLHITLVFLGSVPESEIVRVESMAENVAQEVRPGPALVALDVLDYWKKPRVVCLTTEQPANAQTLRIADLLRERLTAAGFALDPRPFRPHVTLARKASHGSMDTLPPLLWTFREFSLIESQTGPSGSVYRCRARFTFSSD